MQGETLELSLSMRKISHWSLQVFAKDSAAEERGQI